MLLDHILTEDAYKHSERLPVITDDILKLHNLTVSGLSAIAVSAGPGSYTGLRIGVSLAKGLCFASGTPLIAVSTLQSLALAILKTKKDLHDDTLLLPMIDARRMEVYVAGYNTSLEQVLPTEPRILDPTFADYLKGFSELAAGGNGSQKIPGGMIPGMSIVPDTEFSSIYIGELAYKKFQNGEFEDLSTFEPVYLKEFAGIIKKT